MDGGRSVPLTGGEIHGFNTAADLDIKKLMEDASTRWLRPNEVHAILSNYTLLRIQPQPVDLPPSGTLLLFDRKMLRNFRKDGHNWRKKKDGKTVQEAHEKLKIGNEERIHVYYARNEDDPNFYRRCYWLLDKDLERIVLVHYRQTSEENANQVLPMAIESKEALHSTSSPVTPLNSVAVSSHSDMSDSVVVSDEINSIEDYAIYAGSTISSTGGDRKHGVRKLGLDELDRLGWEDIMEQPADIDLSAPGNGNFASADQGVEYQLRDSRNNGHGLQGRFLEEMLSFDHPHGSYPNDGFAGVREQNKVQLQQVEAHKNSPVFTMMNKSNEEKGQHITLGSTETTNAFVNNAFQYQSSFGRWNCVVDESCGSLDDSPVQCQTPDNHMLDAFSSTSQTSNQGKAFSIKDISPSWAYSEEETKIIVVGCFNKSYQHLESSDVFCIFGGYCVPVEPLQVGVYRAKALPHEPGLVEFYLTVDGRTPISEVMNFEYRSISNTPSNSGLSGVTSPSIDSEMPKHKDLEVLIRLSHLLFSTSNCISAISSRISPNSLKEAKKFASQTSSTLENQWMHFLKLKKNDGSSYSAANHDLFELILKSKLQEWILLRVAEGSRTTPRDSHGQGVIHLCAILDYAWAIRLFALSNFSLDFRDARGWTALHWAAYYGRERTVAALLSAHANPSLVTDPTPDNPGGCTAADLASQEGYEGLGAYLAEKGLQAHYLAMALSGNVSEPPPQSSNDPLNNENMESQNFSEQELCLKDSLAAYRNAAGAADRIQAAFRERAHKQQMKAAQLENPEDEAKNIVAALKIQKAFRNYNRRKLMKAAVRIQGTFRTWQARKNFLNLRRQVIKIQAVFRGHQVRRQYHKICWSVGVLEKAVLRWRLKRKGLRGLQAESKNTAQMMDEDNCVEEDFYRVSREQAEDRVKRSVVRVQAMFRSYKAQQEYRRMKLAYNQAKMEFDDFEED